MGWIPFSPSGRNCIPTLVYYKELRSDNKYPFFRIAIEIKINEVKISEAKWLINKIRLEQGMLCQPGGWLLARHSQETMPNDRATVLVRYDRLGHTKNHYYSNHHHLLYIRLYILLLRGYKPAPDGTIPRLLFTDYLFNQRKT
ncbi:MAG: hypothetical protein ACOYOT_02155 [Bacteroidales bacterium]